MTPGFDMSEFETRRSILMKSLPEDSVVVLLGSSIRYMTNNIFYPFHQNTDFWYLCAFNEPDAALVLEKNQSERGYKQTMFVLPKNASAELWDGPRTGVEGAVEFFGADEAFDNTRFQPFFKKILGSTKNIYMDNPGTMPTLLKSETAKKLIETGTLVSSFFKASSSAKKRLIITSQGPYDQIRERERHDYVFFF